MANEFELAAQRFLDGMPKGDWTATMTVRDGFDPEVVANQAIRLAAELGPSGPSSTGLSMPTGVWGSRVETDRGIGRCVTAVGTFGLMVRLDCSRS
jgi:hypothetical protein